MIKVIVILLIVMVVLGGGAFAWVHTHQNAALDPTLAGTSTIARGTIVESVSSTGTVASLLDIPIKCRASGEVLQLGPKDRTKQFDVSDTVKTGDLLMQIDQTDEKRARDQSQAEVSISQAKLEEAKQNLIVAQQKLDQSRETANANMLSAKAQLSDAQAKAQRRKELLAQKLDTQEDYDTAADTAAQMKASVDNAQVAIEQLKTLETQIGIAQQDIELAKAQLLADNVALDEANQQMDYTTITAPQDGTITALSVQKGTIISSATSVVGGSSVMVLSDLSQMFILADVDESEVGGVAAGQDVDITADAFPNKKFSGKVVRIATQGVNVSNVVTFEVKIEITSPNKALLKPSMTTNVNIIQARKENVLLVPISAVLRKDRKEVVTVQGPNNTTVDKPVVLGITDGTNDEVISGLSEGDVVELHKGPGDSRWNAQSGRGGSPFGGRR